MSNLRFPDSACLAALIAVTAVLTITGCTTDENRPNVLLIVIDDLNTDIGAYGHPLVQTPNIDRLAARGLRFDRAYSQFPICNPSRSSFLTGLYPEQAGVLDNGAVFRKQHPNISTLPQWFKEHGYRTARVGKIFHQLVPLQIGTSGWDDKRSWDEVVNPRGIDRDVHDQINSLVPGEFGGTLSWLKINSRDEQHTDGIAAGEAIRLLEQNSPARTGQPFFLAVGFYRPHSPFVAPGKYFDLYPIDLIQPTNVPADDRDDMPVAALADSPGQANLSDFRQRIIIQAYYAAVSFVDAQVGRVLDALTQQGLSDNTIVVIMSDHGYQLGAHGLWQKGDLFEGSVRAPLVIAGAPGQAAGQSTQALVELVDLYPTLVDLAGLPRPRHLAGQSFVRILENPDQAFRAAALTQGWSIAERFHPELTGREIMGYTIRTPRYRYTEWGEGEYGVELYDYQADPDETFNLAGRPAYAGTVLDHKKLLARSKSEAQ